MDRRLVNGRMSQLSMLLHRFEGPDEMSSPVCKRLAERYYRISLATGVSGTLFFLVIPIGAILVGAFTPMLMILSGTVAIALFVVYNRFSTSYAVFKASECFLQNSAGVNLIHYLRKGGMPQNKAVSYRSMECVTVIENSPFIAILTRAGESYYVPTSFVPDVDRLLRDARSFGARIERV